MEHFIREATAEKEAITAMRRRIHSMAECGTQLPNTLDFVNKTLQNMGYHPEACGKCGITAELAAREAHAPVILLRADIDALPMAEKTRLPFRAENGAMHACGHDMHTAMLMGAARLLKTYEGTLPFRVRFAFEGAEETLTGAREMLGGGVLTDVRAAMMLHVISALPLPTGRVLLPTAGVGAPAAVFFRIDLAGDAGHVGEKRGEDAGERAVRLYQRMQGAARSIGRGLSLSIGVLRAGDAPNVLPASATLSGSFRAKDETAVKRFRKLLSRLTAETREARLTFLGDCPPLYNDGRVVSLLASFLPTLGHPCLTPEGRGGSAAEDFAHFAARVPAVCLGLSAGEAGRGYDHPLHHPSVLFDEDALPTGAALYAASAMILGEHLHTFTNPADA